MITGSLVSEDDKSITIELTANNGNTWTLVVAKVGEFTTEELVQRWSRKSKMEYMKDRLNFARYIGRINLRHEKIIAGEIEPVINVTPAAQPAP